MLGYYEMANRMVLQLRAIIASANQVLVPTIADLNEHDKKTIKTLYQLTYRTIFYMSLLVHSLIVVCSPAISIIWIGHHNSAFIIFSSMLAIGWFFNTLSGPAYFVYLGIGRLRWNLISHIIIGVLNLCLGFSMGKMFDGFGVASAWVASLSFGSIVLFLFYHIEQRTLFVDILPKEDIIMFISCVFGVLSVIIISYNFRCDLNSLKFVSLLPILYLFIIFIPFWYNTTRKFLIKLIWVRLF